MMHLKTRFTAGALAFIVMMTSMQFPAETVRAKEVYQEMEETRGVEAETGAEEEEVSESIFSTKEDDFKETGTVAESVTVQETKSELDTNELKDETQRTETAMVETEAKTQEVILEVEETEEEVQTEERTETAKILAAAEDDIASGSYRDTTWVIDVNGKLTVEGTGEFKRFESPWNQYKIDIVSAEINVTGVTDASYMFKGCSNLTKVDLSGFDTSKVTDMEHMFCGCSNLEYVDLSGFDTSKVTNMSCMFNECRKLKRVDVSGFDTSKVTDMSWMFRACNSLTNIDVSGFDTSKVTDMSCMFGGCNMTSMDISNFDISNVTDMDYIFYSCSLLKNVKMNVTGVTQYMFQECDSLESAEMNVTGVTNLKSLFRNCKNLKSVEISSNDTGKVTDMAAMFSGCSSLINVDFSGFDTRNVTDMGYMFDGCSSLESLDLGSFDIGNVTNIKGIFSGCSQLSELHTPCNLNVSEELSGIWYQSDGKQISTLPQSLGYSIFIMKDQIPSITNPCVKVMKKKTVYECGDALNVNDLTVRYYDIDGTSKIVTDYTTNADDIEMSISGIKTLIVTYNGFSAEVKLTVNEKKDASEKESVKITRISMPDTVYTGKESGYIGTAVVKSQNGKDITEKVKLIYTYSGIMADNSVYADTEKAPVDAGDYKLTVEVSEDDENYTGSREYIFKIIKAPVKISALDVTIETGSSLPKEYNYQVSGLLNDDVLIKEPSITCNADTTRGGRYAIVPSGADAGMNYEITYANGTLSVESELHGSYEGIIWDIDSNGRLIVEGTGEFSGSFGTERAPWYQYRENIMSAEIDVKGITNASYMFAGLENMTSLNLKELDTRNTKNMIGLFTDCSSLNDLDLSNFDTSNATDMMGMFQNCNNLKNLDVSNFNTHIVRDMSSMFKGCSGLSSLDVSNFNTDIVTDMNSMFWGCSGLSSLDLTNFDTSKVENMSGMFWGCSRLTDIDLTNFNTSKVKSMSYMFSYCNKLVSIELSNFNTENVTTMASMFSRCNSLVNIDLSGFDTGKVKNMSGLFEYCGNLPDLELGNFDTSNTTEMDRMFNQCCSLEEIDLRNFNTSNVTSMYYMFGGCETLTDLDLSNFDTSKVTTMLAMFDGCSGLKSIDLSSFDTSNVTNMYYMFRDCSSLTSLKLSNFNTSKVTTMYYMFSGCKSLKSIDLSSFDTSNVTSIGGIIDRCDDLIIIHTPYNFAFSVLLPTNTGETWYQQDGKESLKLPQNLDYSIIMTRSSCIAYGSFEDITWVVNADGKLIVEGTGEFSDSIGESRAPWCQYWENIKSAEINIKGMTNAAYMFAGCHYMESIDLSKFDISEVTDMSYMFFACDSLTNLDLGSLDAGKVLHATDMFSQCSKLTTICTPKNLTFSVSLPVDSDEAWYQQDGTKLFTLPQSLNYSIIIARNELPVISVDYIASGKNKGITWTIDREGKLTAKGKGNFSNSERYNRAPWYDYSTDIKSAEINIQKMSDASYMFYGCSNLEKVDIDNFDTEEVINVKYLFSGCNSLTGMDLSGFNTSKIKNMKAMFSGCSSLINLDLSSFDTSNVIDMSSMFSGCSSLESINLSSFDTGKVQDMMSMFNNCSSLISLDLSNFDTSRVCNQGTGMQTMFAGCSNLTSLDLSSFDTHGVSMTGMFAGCSNLTSLDLSSFDTRNALDMTSMFKGCSNLTSLDLSSFDTRNVWYMTSMFAGCSNLTSLDLSSFDTRNVWSMGSMFAGCSNLTSLDLGNFDTSKVNAFYDMFSGCSGLTSLDLSNFDTSSANDYNYVHSMRGMFQNCSNLISLDISNFDTSKVSNIRDMFHGCSSLTSLDLSSFDMKRISADMSDVFKDCDSLSIIHTPYNLNYTIELPVDLENIWYTSDGVAITELPKNLENSVTIKKDKIPNTSEPHIEVEKVKTIYELGDILYTDDLTVKYHDAKGMVKTVTDYTTNAEQIDMLTTGTKALIVTYGEYTAEILLVVKGKEKLVEISGITVSDVVYTGNPFAYTGTAMVTTDGVDITTVISLIYTYTGTMADGNIYEASSTAPVNAGNYKLTIAVSNENSNYKGNAEYAFKITKAPIEITASNIILFTGDSVPATYKYQVKGLLNEDKLITTPSFNCNANMMNVGTYEIIPYDADAGMNYEITYTNGILIVRADTGEKEIVTISGIEISDRVYTGKALGYNGSASVKLQDGLDITDSVILNYSYSGKQADGSTYGPSEVEPVNAGEYILKVAVAQDDFHYSGSIEYRFAITKVTVNVTALDKVFQIGEGSSLPSEYPYEVMGLLEGDKLTTEPSFIYTDMDGKEISRDNISLKKAGSYYVIPKEADAGMNYEVFYQKGILTVKGTTGDLPDDDKESEVFPEDIPQTGIPTTGIIWTSVVEDQFYTGTAVKPDIRVYFDKKRLTEKADYTIAYKNNKNLGMADIIITGKGNYKDKKIVHFNIVQKDISDKDVVIEDMAYADDGKQHKVAPNVVYNGKKLKLGKDFTIEYGAGDYTAAGDYYATITGKGNYKGTYDKVKTTIIDKNMLLNKAKVTKIPNQEYNKGQEIILPDSAIVVTLNGTVLTKDTDYTVDYVNNCNVGKASVVIRGKGKYAGTKTVSFKIVRTPVNMGEADIVCSYSKEAVFCKGGAMPAPKVSYNGETLRDGADYTVSYKNNKKCGTAFLIIKGKGSFKGSRSFEYTVKQKALSAVAVRVPDMVFVNKANKYQSKPILTDTDGNILKAGTDYIVTGYVYDGKTLDKQDNPPENARITVTLEGKGSYNGTCTASYQLRAGTNLNKAKITIADQSYMKSAVKPTESAITEASIKVNGTAQNLVYGRDYEIAAYGSNLKKGTGTVVLRGLGRYCGEKTVKFKIVGKSVE